MEDTSLSSEKPLRATYSTRRKKGTGTPSARKEDGDVRRIANNIDNGTTRGERVSLIDKLKEASPNVPRTPPVSKASRRSTAQSTLDVAARSPDKVEDESQSSVVPPEDEAKESEAAMPPPSVIEKSTSREGDHDELSDDTVSVAESSRATRKRKNEHERKEWFLEDKDCEVLEPHRVKCTRCKQWVDLHSKRKYVMKFWLAHKKTCEEEEDDNVQESVEPEPPSEEPVVPEPAETDPRQTQGEETGDLQSGELVSSTEKAGEDEAPSQDNAQEDDNVMPSPPERGSPQSPQREPSPSSSKKREREASDEEEDEPARAVRPRTASYVAPSGHSLWHTLTLPFRSFVEGFKQGLSRDSC